MELGHLGDDEHQADCDARGVGRAGGQKRIEAASGSRGGLARRIASTWSTLGGRTLQLQEGTGKKPRILQVFVAEADREPTDGILMGHRSDAGERRLHGRATG